MISIYNDDSEGLEELINPPLGFRGNTCEPDFSSKRLIIRRSFHKSPKFAKAILDSVNLISEYFSLPSLCYTNLSSNKIILTESSIQQLIDAYVISAKKGTGESLILSNHPNANNYFLICFSHRWYAKDYDELSINLPNDEDSLMPWAKFFGDLCSVFGAYHSYIRDSWLSELHGRRLRIHNITYMDEPPLPGEIVSDPITKVPDSLPLLFLPHEFDTTLVPDGVWWLNYWSAPQINSLGRERVLSADWEKIIEQSDGSLVLIATNEVLDVTNIIHIERISTIVRYLKLKECQEKYLINPNL